MIHKILLFCYNILKGVNMDNVLLNDDFLLSLTPKNKRIVKKAIEIYADYVDYMDAKKVLDNINSGAEKTYSLEEVKKKYNIK